MNTTTNKTHNERTLHAPPFPFELNYAAHPAHPVCGSDLLEASGVDTVPELAKRKPETLAEKMVEVNNKKKLVRRPPGLARIKNWAAQAKKLPKVIKH